ncbi:hypothetical protein B4N84_14060 [Flavobacterium sp. IR1]|nr:hypothetical protein B4N84_14060 [Flavobacterium sp. IR1]
MRIEQLTFTRFIAAIIIVFFHYGKDLFVFDNSYLRFFIEQADVCVSYFFILSGFIMIVAYKGKLEINALDFLRSRLARIYPVYFLTIILIFIGLIFLNEFSIYDLFLNVFMIQSWFPGKALTLNLPGWSISVEFFFYVLFPFLFNSIYRKINIKMVTIFIVLFWILSQVVLHFMFSKTSVSIFGLGNSDLLFFPLMHLNEFLLGNLAGIYFVKRFSDLKKNFDLEILVILLLIVFALIFSSDLIYHNGLLAVFFVPLIILLSANNGVLTTVFINKNCVFLGEISFGIYLLQQPVWVYLSDYRLNKYFHLDKIEDYTLSFFIRLTVLLFIAAICYKFFELPIRNKIKNKLN